MKLKRVRTDDLIMFSSFTIIAVILLFSVGYFTGNFGFGIVSILLSIAVYFAVVWGKSLGRSFANAPADTSKVEGEAIIIALACLGYSVYLSLGLQSLVKYLTEKVDLGLSFFLWLTSFTFPIIFLVCLISYRRFK